MKEQPDTQGQDHGLTVDLLTVLEGYFEPATILRNILDPTSVQVRGDLFLEPFAVGDEILDGQRIGKFAAENFLITFDGQVFLWSGDVGCFRPRTQEHALGHILLPESHGIPNDIGLHPGSQQIGSRTQSVRTCSDDNYFLLLRGLAHMRTWPAWTMTGCLRHK